MELPGGFLTEADAVVQPFHLPRFEHSANQPSLGGSVGTAAERDEIVDKTLNGGDHEAISLGLAHLPPASSNARLDYEEEDRDEGNATDLEEIVPAIEQAYEIPTGRGVPKTMQEIAEAAALKKSGISNVDVVSSRTKTPLPDVATAAAPSVSGQPKVHETRTSGRQTPKTNKGGSASKKNSAPSKVRSRRRQTPTSDIDIDPDNDGDPGDWDEFQDEDEGADRPARKHKAKPARSDLKRKRTESVSAIPAPHPSTRVLRARAPKSAEKLKAEKEAELAYRKATAE